MHRLALAGVILCHVMFFKYFLYYKKQIKYLTTFDRALILILYFLFLFFYLLLYLSILPSNTTSSVFISPSPILSLNECSLIIHSAESAARVQGGWNTSRHRWYPTTDISAYSIKELISPPAISSSITLSSSSALPLIKFNDWINRTVHQLIFPLLSQSYNIPPEDYLIQDLFIVKYDLNGQTSLPVHRDSSMVTFNIALSQEGEDYHGGGTRFLITDPLVTNVPRGYMMSHESKVYHSGHPITSGTRYILIGFVNVRSSFFPLWWKGFGAYARCLDFPVNSLTIIDERSTVVCRSWVWFVSYHLQTIAEHLYYALHPSLSPYHSGETPVNSSSSEQSNNSFPYILVGVLGILFLLLFTVIGLLISICCLSDEFTAHYCFYPLYVLGVLTQQQQLLETLDAEEMIDVRMSRKNRSSGVLVNEETKQYADGEYVKDHHL
jgi:hypothetical protein